MILSAFKGWEIEAFEGVSILKPFSMVQTLQIQKSVIMVQPLFRLLITFCKAVYAKVKV